MAEESQLSTGRRGRVCFRILHCYRYVRKRASILADVQGALNLAQPRCQVLGEEWSGENPVFPECFVLSVDSTTQADRADLESW